MGLNGKLSGREGGADLTKFGNKLTSMTAYMLAGSNELTKRTHSSAIFRQQTERRLFDHRLQRVASTMAHSNAPPPPSVSLIFLYS